MPEPPDLLQQLVVLQESGSPPLELDLLIPSSHQLAAFLELDSLIYLPLLSKGGLLLCTSQLGLVGGPHPICPLIRRCRHLQPPLL